MRRAGLGLVGLVVLVACSFDGTGQTAAGGSGAGVGTTTGTSGDATSGGSGTSGGPGVTTGGVGMSGTSGALDETTGAGSTETATTLPPVTTIGESTTSDETTTTAADPSTTTGDPSTTTGGDNACPGPIVKILEKVADAELEWPMGTEQSMLGEGTIATSAIPEAGTVEFTVDIPCVDEFAVWARVYDGDPGVHDFGDPDSYYVRVDGGSEITWFYGCQTWEASQEWGWYRTRGANGGTCGEAVDWTLPLGPGAHTIRFRNRESQTNEGIRAAIARIFVTNDPSYVPTLE